MATMHDMGISRAYHELTLPPLAPTPSSIGVFTL